MGANPENSKQTSLLGQALEVFNKKIEVSKYMQEIKKEVNNDCEQKVLQIQNTSIVPAELRGKTQELIEITKMAEYRGVPFLLLANNIMFIDGKMGWKSTYIISCINKASDRFSAPLNYRTVGKEGEKSYGKRAYTYDLKGNLVEGPVVTIQIAETAGWTKKENSSWNTLPELMLSYRAATLFGRLFVPELLDGMHTADELIDIYSVSGTLPKDAIDQKLIEAMAATECLVIEETKHEVKNHVIELKTKLKTKSVLDVMLDDLEQNGWMATNPTFYNGKFFIKIEPITDVANTHVISKWEFCKANSGSLVRDVTSILTEGEKNDFK